MAADPPVDPAFRLRLEAGLLERLRARAETDGDEVLLVFLERELDRVHTNLLDLEFVVREIHARWDLGAQKQRRHRHPVERAVPPAGR